MPSNSLPNQVLAADETDLKESTQLASGANRKWFERLLKAIIDFAGAGALLLALHHIGEGPHGMAFPLCAVAGGLATAEVR